MKKISLLLLVLFSYNCEDNLSDNIPAFQALVNGNNHWVADDFSATIQNNQLYINGISPFGSITIVVDTNEANQYDFSSSSQNLAVFQDTLQYSTQNDGINSIAYLSEGFLDIQDFDNINSTISGHFNFDAYNGTGEFTVNISEGVFYKIPLNYSVDQD